MLEASKKILFCLLIFFSTTILLARGEGTISTTPPRGWNSYDSFSFTISEEEFLENAKIVAERLKPHGYEYVVIDYLWYRELKHGWFSKSTSKTPGYDKIDEYGRPVPDPKRWPSTVNGKGFAPIAEKIHAMGLKLGIHVMRGISTAAAKRKTPVLGGKGWNARDIALMHEPCPWMERCFVGVNSTSEGGKMFIKSLYEQYASWGIDFIKHDCVFGAENPQFDEIREVSNAIRESGRPMVYSISPGDQATPGLAARVAQFVNMYRVTKDDWDRWTDIERRFDVARDFAAAGLIGIPSIAGGKSWVDLDMLPFGRLTDAAAAYGPYRNSKLSLHEKRTQITLWAMAKSPLMFGGDLRRLNNKTLELLTNPTVLEVNSHSSGNREVASKNLFERVWFARGSNPDQVYIALFNLSWRTRTVTFSLLDLIQQHKRNKHQQKQVNIFAYEDEFISCSGKEAWSNKQVLVANFLSDEVPGHGALLFSLQCKTDHRNS